MECINRRLEDRFETDGAAYLEFEPAGNIELIEARVRDVSKSGIRIHVGQLIAEGCKPMVKMGELLIKVEVRRCRPISDSIFELGLRIIEVEPCSNHLAGGDFLLLRPRRVSAFSRAA